MPGGLFSGCPAACFCSLSLRSVYSIPQGGAKENRQVWPCLLVKFVLGGTSHRQPRTPFGPTTRMEHPGSFPGRRPASWHLMARPGPPPWSVAVGQPVAAALGGAEPLAGAGACAVAQGILRSMYSWAMAPPAWYSPLLMRMWAALISANKLL